MTIPCARCALAAAIASGLPGGGAFTGPEPEAAVAAGCPIRNEWRGSLPELQLNKRVPRPFGSELAARGRRAFVLGSLAWAATILYGTLATKQHWLADLPPAFVLAFVADRLAWRGAARRSAPARFASR